MDERRKSQRRVLYRYLEVFEGKTKRPVGRLINLTPEGMLLMCEKAIGQNAPLKLRINLPAGVWDSKAITVEGECRWSGQSYNPDYFDAGFKFTKVPEAASEAIDLMLRFQAFKS